MSARIRILLVGWPVLLALVFFISFQTLEPIRSATLKWLFWMFAAFLPLAIYTLREDPGPAQPRRTKKRKVAFGTWKTQAFFIAWPGLMMALFAVLQIKEPLLMPVLKWLVWMYVAIIPLAVYTLRDPPSASLPRAEEVPNSGCGVPEFDGPRGFVRHSRSRQRSDMPYVERVD